MNTDNDEDKLECSKCGRFILTPASHATTCPRHPEADEDTLD